MKSCSCKKPSPSLEEAAFAEAAVPAIGLSLPSGRKIGTSITFTTSAKEALECDYRVGVLTRMCGDTEKYTFADEVEVDLAGPVQRFVGRRAIPVGVKQNTVRVDLSGLIRDQNLDDGLYHKYKLIVSCEVDEDGDEVEQETTFFLKPRGPAAGRTAVIN